jgi:sensor histidine kinase YesM
MQMQMLQWHRLLNENGIGIQNVKKRLEFLYQDNYELKMNDEEDFFVVSLLLELNQENKFQPAASVVSVQHSEKVLL